MKNRTTLRSYFVTNNIPTETNFQEFIDSSLNQEEDGIRKAENGPIGLEAQGPGGELLHLYGSFKDSAALWKISHKPAKPGEIPGLNIADAQASRFFLKAEDGSVGIGTGAPTQKLDVEGGILARSQSPISNQGAHLQWNRTGGDGETWLLNQKGGGNANAGIRFGSATTANAATEWARFTDNGNFGIGTTAPDRPLTVQGAGSNHEWLALKASDGKTRFHLNGASGGLNLAESGVADYRLFVRPGGNVGLGTATPEARLHIDGAVKINGANTLEFGSGVAGKEVNAGKIGYGTFDGGASLNIVGAGTGSNRRIQLWNEGGATFNGSVEVRTDDKSAAITVGTRGGTGGAVYLGNANHGLKRGFPELNSNNHVGLYTTDGNLYLSGRGADSSQLVLTNAGNVGIGTDAPGAPLEIRRPNSHAYMLFHTPGTHWFSFGQDRTANDDIKISEGNGFGERNYLTVQRSTGNVGINTTNPRGTFDVNGEIRIGGSKPIVFQRYINLGDNALRNTNYSSAIYAAAIIGMNAKNGDVDEGGANGASIIDCRMLIQNGTWWIRADFKSHGKNEDWDIDVMFVDRRMADLNGY